MKKSIVSIILLVALISMNACSSSTNQQDPGKGTEIKADTSKKEAMAANYICPMGKECGYSDKPGKCNSCGMDLVAAK
jgi:hypothetical protein